MNLHQAARKGDLDAIRAAHATGKEGRFLEPIADPKALAKRMYAFCPDIVDQGCGTVGRLAKELVKTQRFFFWWD